MKKEDLYLNELSQVSKSIFRSRKSHTVAYILATTLGWAGAHWVYLEKKTLAVIRIIITVATILISLGFLNFIDINISIPIAIVSITLFISWGVADLILVSNLMRRDSVEHEKELVRELSEKRNTTK